MENLDNFCANKNTKDNLSNQCKVCAKTSTAKYKSSLTSEQLEGLKQRDRERYANRTPEKIEHDRKVKAKYRANLTEEQKETYRKRAKLAGIKYRNSLTEKQKEAIRAYDRERYYKNKLNKRMSSGILDSLSYSKSEQSWQRFVSYSKDELEERLLSTVNTPECNINILLIGDYEIDHIIPKSLFTEQIQNNAKTRAFQVCWSLLNLRLLPKIENRCRPKDGSDIDIRTICNILFQYIPVEFTEQDTNNLESVLDSINCNYYYNRKIDLEPIIVNYCIKNKKDCFKVI